eukprot:gene3748-8365_t
MQSHRWIVKAPIIITIAILVLLQSPISQTFIVNTTTPFPIKIFDILPLPIYLVDTTEEIAVGFQLCFGSSARVELTASQEIESISATFAQWLNGGVVDAKSVTWNEVTKASHDFSPISNNITSVNTLASTFFKQQYSLTVLSVDQNIPVTLSLTSDGAQCDCATIHPDAVNNSTIPTVVPIKDGNLDNIVICGGQGRWFRLSDCQLEGDHVYLEVRKTFPMTLSEIESFAFNGDGLIKRAFNKLNVTLDTSDSFGLQVFIRNRLRDEDMIISIRIDTDCNPFLEGATLNPAVTSRNTTESHQNFIVTVAVGSSSVAIFVLSVILCCCYSPSTGWKCCCSCSYPPTSDIRDGNSRRKEESEETGESSEDDDFFYVQRKDTNWHQKKARKNKAESNRSRKQERKRKASNAHNKSVYNNGYSNTNTKHKRKRRRDNYRPNLQHTSRKGRRRSSQTKESKWHKNNKSSLAHHRSRSFSLSSSSSSSLSSQSTASHSTEGSSHSQESILKCFSCHDSKIANASCESVEISENEIRKPPKSGQKNKRRTGTASNTQSLQNQRRKTNNAINDPDVKQKKRRLQKKRLGLQKKNRADMLRNDGNCSSTTKPINQFQQVNSNTKVNSATNVSQQIASTDTPDIPRSSSASYLAVHLLKFIRKKLSGRSHHYEKHSTYKANTNVQKDRRPLSPQHLDFKREQEMGMSSVTHNQTPPHYPSSSCEISVSCQSHILHGNETHCYQNQKSICLDYGTSTPLSACYVNMNNNNESKEEIPPPLYPRKSVPHEVEPTNSHYKQMIKQRFDLQQNPHESSNCMRRLSRLSSNLKLSEKRDQQNHIMQTPAIVAQVSTLQNQDFQCTPTGNSASQFEQTQEKPSQERHTKITSLIDNNDFSFKDNNSNITNLPAPYSHLNSATKCSSQFAINVFPKIPATFPEQTQSCTFNQSLTNSSPISKAPPPPPPPMIPPAHLVTHPQASSSPISKAPPPPPPLTIPPAHLVTHPQASSSPISKAPPPPPPTIPPAHPVTHPQASSSPISKAPPPPLPPPPPLTIPPAHPVTHPQASSSPISKAPPPPPPPPPPLTIPPAYLVTHPQASSSPISKAPPPPPPLTIPPAHPVTHPQASSSPISKAPPPPPPTIPPAHP